MPSPDVGGRSQRVGGVGDGVASGESGIAIPAGLKNSVLLSSWVLLVWPAAPIIGRSQEPGGHPGMKHSMGKVALPAGGGSCAGSRDGISVLILHSSEETRRPGIKVKIV